LSIITAILDYSVFVLLFTFTHLILLSFIGARIVAGSFNFYFNKSFVFYSREHLIKKAWKFSALVLGFMLLSYVVVRFLVHDFGVNIYFAKVLTEGFLFFSSFAIQRIFIFNE